MKPQSLTKTQSPANKTVRTTRLDIAAFLLVRGFEIAQVEAQESTITFVFHDGAGRGETVTLDFYRGATVSANEYADAQKRVRDLMWEAKRRYFGRKE